ncbi:MAG: hypothetical protein HY243_06110 [Proteobacteria bacterium]|nr:hypothetical protein [Pseudomonadota bacterium]
MKKLAAIVCLFLTGCVTDRVDTSYHGSDAGVLVFSAGSIAGKRGVQIFYRKVGQPSGVRGFGGDGSIYYNPGSIFTRDPDFTGHETGEVTVQHLEPGEYEIYTWQVAEGMGGLGEVLWSPRSDFSLRFTVRPGQTTYIGDYARFQFPGAYTAFTFVISDKHERDIAIAKKVEPNLPPVTIQVPDVSRLNEPSLLSKEPF